MVEMGDKKNQGGIDVEDFIELMSELGLINKKNLEDKNVDKN